MTRPLRIEFAGAWYHVMNRGAGRRTVFRCERHRKGFLSLLEEISETFRVEIHAYCLLENHYHLVIHTPEAGLSRPMRHLNGVYTQWFNRVEETDGPLFRGRFAAKVVDSEAYLARLTRYVHLNPVEAGIVQSPEHYEDSSCRAYLGLSPPPVWLHTRRCLEMFGNDINRARRSYRKFLEEGLDDEFRDYHLRGTDSPFLGDDEFRRKIRCDPAVMARCWNPEQPSARRVSTPSLDTVAREVCVEFEVDPEVLRRPARGRDEVCSDARGAFVFVCRRDGGHPLIEVAKRLGYRGRSGASSAMSRLRRKLDERPELERRLHRIRSRLYQLGPRP